MIFFTMWKVQAVFSLLWILQCRFSTTQKEWFEIFHKPGSKIMCKVNIELIYFQTGLQLNLVESWSSMPWYDENCTVCHAKMSKITHNVLCEKCWKSRYFWLRILARFLHLRKIFEVFHVSPAKIQVISQKQLNKWFIYIICIGGETRW